MPQARHGELPAREIRVRSATDILAILDHFKIYTKAATAVGWEIRVRFESIVRKEFRGSDGYVWILGVV